MNLANNQQYTDLLEIGDTMLITPSGGTTIVELQPQDGQSAVDNLTAAKRYGPFTRPVVFRVTALSGRCTVAQVKILTPLHVAGWEDLRFPVQGINPAGAADAPAVDTTLTGYPGTLLFSGSQDNTIAGIAKLPNTWQAGTAIRPYIHWSKPVGSASAVSWVLYYRVLGSAGEVHGSLTGPVAGTLAAGDMETANMMLMTTFDEIDLTGQKKSTCLAWQLRRLGNTDADTAPPDCSSWISTTRSTRAAP